MLVQRVVRQCISYYIFFSWDIVNANIIEDHALPGKVSHFPKQSAMLERNIEQSGGKERCIQCHFEMKFAPGC